MTRAAVAVAALAIALPGPLAGCGAAEARSGPPTRTLTVFAAASLKGTFTELGRQLETAHPGTHVAFSFAGSADLVTQLQQGAPADVLATADTATMDKAVADGLVRGTPVPFASNTLEIAVPRDNPGRVRSFADLARPGVSVVVCAPAVPCGSAAQKVEAATGVDLQPVSEESAVTDVLNKVQTGEADAGLVYATDVRAAKGEVTGLAFPESAEAVNHYPVALLAGSAAPELAQQFTALVTGADGRRVLVAAGFGGP